MFVCYEMEQRESVEQNSIEIIQPTTSSSPKSDIDQLCHLIDQSTFGGCLPG